MSTIGGSISNNTFSTKTPRERTFLIGVELKRERPLLPVEESIKELAMLADTAGLNVVGQTIQRLDRPYTSTYIGSGKIEEVKILTAELEASVIIFDDELNPRHQRELEKLFGEKIKLLDRTALILDIFALHAHTREGKLQVELAQLEYRIPRLTRMWTHLVRQAGGRAGGASGGVGLRGPGEKQIEMDRREIGKRITYLKEQIDVVRARREQHRQKRQQTELQVIAIVGYTNTGKSTLLNKISNANVLSADKLFATLDPTTRKVIMPGGREALFTDTVGFIQKLPTQIIAAFRATLEEIIEADVLLHVVDATHPQATAQIEAVEDTLAELEVDEIPRVMALNKIDLLPDGVDITAVSPPNNQSVAVSSVTGVGLDELMVLIEAVMTRYLRPIQIQLPYKRGDLLSLFHERGQVDSVQHTAEGTMVYGRLPQRLIPYFEPYKVSEQQIAVDKK